ncbi:MAG: transposase [bacterium]
MHRTTPMRWTQKVSEKNPILVLNRKIGCHLSGVLCLDEVHYRVNGKKVCGLAAIDPNGNWLVHFKQVKRRDKDTIRKFLQEIKETYLGEDILFFVTDGYKGYIEPMMELFPRAKHQLCKFHVMRDINKEIRQYVEEKRRKQRSRLPKPQKK